MYDFVGFSGSREEDQRILTGHFRLLTGRGTMGTFEAGLNGFYIIRWAYCGGKEWKVVLWMRNDPIAHVFKLGPQLVGCLWRLWTFKNWSLVGRHVSLGVGNEGL